MAYEAYHHGQLEDYEYPAEKVEEATLAPARLEPNAKGRMYARPYRSRSGH